MAKDIEDIVHLENLKLASLKSRSFAYVIDDLIISLLVVAIFFDSFSNATDPLQTIELINQAFFEIIAIKVIYHTFFIWQYGQSVGKMIARIKVVQIDILDKPILIVSFNRAIFRVFSEVIFYLGFLIAFFDKSRQSLHDKISKTLVLDAS